MANKEEFSFISNMCEFFHYPQIHAMYSALISFVQISPASAIVVVLCISYLYGHRQIEKSVDIMLYLWLVACDFYVCACDPQCFITNYPVVLKLVIFHIISHFCHFTNKCYWIILPFRYMKLAYVDIAINAKISKSICLFLFVRSALKCLSFFSVVVYFSLHRPILV